MAGVKSHWEIPHAIKDRSDKAVISFKVLRDGTLRGIHVDDAGQSALGVNAGLMAVMNAGAPALPSDFRGLCLELTVAFYYNMTPPPGESIGMGDPCKCVP